MASPSPPSSAMASKSRASRLAEALVAERRLGWINPARRLGNDFEATIDSALAWLLIALAFLLTRRLARLSGQET
jgi:hypothetical protein